MDSAERLEFLLLLNADMLAGQTEVSEALGVPLLSRFFSAARCWSSMPLSARRMRCPPKMYNSHSGLDRTYGSWTCQAELTKRTKVNGCYSALTLSTAEIPLVTAQDTADCTKWTEQTGINISPPSPAASIRWASLKSAPAASAQSNVLSLSSLSVFLCLHLSLLAALLTCVQLLEGSSNTECNIE